MKRRVLRRLSILLGWVLGISACRSDWAEYGVPSGEFELDGRVVEQGTTNGIPSIQVIFNWDTTYTDASGAWGFSAVRAFPCDSECSVTASDVDGASNGSYQEATKEFGVNKTADGDGSWFWGYFSADGITVEMEPDSGTSP